MAPRCQISGGRARQSLLTPARISTTPVVISRPDNRKDPPLKIPYRVHDFGIRRSERQETQGGCVRVTKPILRKAGCSVMEFAPVDLQDQAIADQEVDDAHLRDKHLRSKPDPESAQHDADKRLKPRTSTWVQELHNLAHTLDLPRQVLQRLMSEQPQAQGRVQYRDGVGSFEAPRHSGRGRKRRVHARQRLPHQVAGKKVVHRSLIETLMTTVHPQVQAVITRRPAPPELEGTHATQDSALTNRGHYVRVGVRHGEPTMSNSHQRAIPKVPSLSGVVEAVLDEPGSTRNSPMF